MTPIAQMDCCTMLGIDPKTLRNWLRHAGMQFIAHPTDARLKCLTPEQIQQLAILHVRPLQMTSAASPALQEAVTPLESPDESTPAKRENEAPFVAAPAPLSEDAELRKTVCSLEAKVTTLQEHLTQLTLELLRERTERYEQRLSALEALLSQQTGMSCSPPELVMVGDQRQEAPSKPERVSLPVELRARARVIACVEYGATGCYVFVCPREGVQVEQSGSADEHATGAKLHANASRRKGSSMREKMCYPEMASCSFLFHATLCFVLDTYRVSHVIEKCLKRFFLFLDKGCSV